MYVFGASKLDYGGEGEGGFPCVWAAEPKNNKKTHTKFTTCSK